MDTMQQTLTDEYIALKRAIEDKRQQMTRVNHELIELLEQCTHEEVEVKTRYNEGSYYDRASTTQYKQCQLCGKRGPEDTETHSYYG